jgi:hypothetical protein
MDYKTLFYWITVADNAKLFFGWATVFFAVVFIITQICRFIEAGENGFKDQEFFTKVNKWTWYSTPFLIIFLSLWVFTPSKKDALLIVAGGQTLNFLTTDKSTRQIPAELSGFILTELKNQAKEAAVDLNISSQKDKILKEAEGLTGKELLERIKTDSTFAKIISEN